MIKRCDENDFVNIDKYIENNYGKCLYLYLDIIKYGFFNPNIKVWIDKYNNAIKCVVLKYYTGMHIYTKENEYDFSELVNLIEEEQPTVVCGERFVIESLQNKLQSNDYKAEYGWVRCMSEKYVCDNDNVEIAKISDLSKITELVIKDIDIANSYTYENLYNQLKERNIEKYGRNYIIRDNNKIVAHASTGAENDKVGVLCYVMTDEIYRGKGLATKVCSKLCNDLIDEGKKIYLINYTNESTGLYDKLGFKVLCDWGKLYKNNKMEVNKNGKQD